MKITNIIAVAALVFAPALASAQTVDTLPRAAAPLAGGVALGPLLVLTAIPAGATVVGGLVVVIASGLVIGIVAGDGDGTPGTTGTTGTTSTTGTTGTTGTF